MLLSYVCQVERLVRRFGKEASSVVVKSASTQKHVKMVEISSLASFSGIKPIGGKLFQKRENASDTFSSVKSRD